MLKPLDKLECLIKNKSKRIFEGTVLNETWVETIKPITDKIRRYHRHRVVGINNIPKDGPVIIACNHSLATYDMILLMSAIYTRIRYPRSLISRAFSKLPYLTTVMENFGGIQSTHENAHELLEQGHTIHRSWWDERIAKAT